MLVTDQTEDGQSKRKLKLPGGDDLLHGALPLHGGWSRRWPRFLQLRSLSSV